MLRAFHSESFPRACEVRDPSIQRERPRALTYYNQPNRPEIWVYFVKARTILAAMWRKKMEAMNERDRTMTTNGSLEGQCRCPRASSTVFFSLLPFAERRNEHGAPR